MVIIMVVGCVVIVWVGVFWCRVICGIVNMGVDVQLTPFSPHFHLLWFVWRWLVRGVYGCWGIGGVLLGDN